MSAPRLTLVTGSGDRGRGGAGDEAREDREWLAAWEGIAEACEAGLTGLHPQHPGRAEMLDLTRDARRCARLPPEPNIREAGE